MSSIFIKYGALSGDTILKTTLPFIGLLSCVIISGDPYVSFGIKNEDSLTADIEVSFDSGFSNSQTASVASGVTQTFDLLASNNPPGSTTVYARAIASGKLYSSTRTRTSTISTCS